MLNDCFSFRKFNFLLCPIHINPETEFLYVNKGELSISYENTELLLHAGDMAIISPYRLHGFSAENDSDIWVIMFPYYISDEFLKEYGGYEADVIFRPSEKIISYLDGIYRNDNEENIPSSYMQKGLYNCLVAEYIEKTVFSKTESRHSSNVQKILQYLTVNVYSEDVTLENIANSLELSPSVIGNEFKNYLGIPLPKLILNLRLSRALHLLHDKNLSVIDIAYQSGFGSVRTFNRAFKDVYKMTPKEYRAKYE